jgi:hypothetical protein
MIVGTWVGQCELRICILPRNEGRAEYTRTWMAGCCGSESADVPLRPAPEAFGCALLPAAVERKADLVLDTPVHPRWSANVTALQDVWRGWWKYRQIGVWAPDARDGNGARGVVIRTNLREHPTFADTDWLRCHGGALAAVGHLLSDVAGTLVISSSHPCCYGYPWGTHWETDPLWSSSRLDVVHYGAEHWREDKLREIAGEDLVRRHLRVCYKNLSPEGNCGHCEKCLRTMLVLSLTNQLEDFPVFENRQDLAEQIGRLRTLRPYLLPVYEGFMSQSTDPQVVAALRGLIARTRCRPLRLARWAKGVARSTVHHARRTMRMWGL